jgi:hypothetical protein
MIEHKLVAINVEKARQLTAYLARLSIPPGVEIGDLVADLSDLYAAAAHYQRLLDQILQTAPSDDEQLSELLADLGVELEHIADHAGTAHPSIETLAESLD